MQKIFTIPAGMPFAKSLAASLLEEYANAPETLPEILILLPTRRACRTLREAFLQINDGKPLMLPILQAIGDIDEEELAISIAGQEGTQRLLDLPPVLPSMQRQILLARAIQKHQDLRYGFDQALALAKTLSHLMDQIYTENLDIRDMAHLVPEDFADHWQITLDFLTVLSETWPQILKDMNVIDAADRRNRLINALADFWDETKPQKRIIAAGTTGSIPATAKLLNTIYNLPNGQIILPGLDQQIDEESWESLSESHPQYGFKHLLATMNIDRDRIADWQTTLQDHPLSKARRKLSSELMRPSQTSHKWQDLNSAAFDPALENLKIFECDTAQHEAQVIASLMRQTLEDPKKTAALITPDRNLAKRVSSACLRWGIKIDDSAGEPLSRTQIGHFLLLSIEATINKLSPVSLLALLKQPLTHANLKQHLEKFEKKMLRGFKPAAGITGLRQCWADNGADADLHILIDDLERIFEDCIAITETKNNFKEILEAHIKLCESLHDDKNLWSGEDGNAASVLLSEIISQAHNFPKITSHEYKNILQQFLLGVTLRPTFGTHPRLQILGQLEARLIDADLVILGGLNEGTWPSDPGHDPWMSRPMREGFGLPGSERSIGLSAHDFVQGFCTPNVALTRSKLVDGSPSVPARWLARLETVLKATDTKPEKLHDNVFMQWMKSIDHASISEPFTRPAPKPPAESRPRKLSITKIETWLKDPYAIYAHSILSLRKLEPLEKESDAALRGDMLHDCLNGFVTENPNNIPKNAACIILDAAQNFLQSRNLTDEDWHFYWPRFAKITDQFLEKEEKWRAHSKPLKTEIKGEMVLNTPQGDFVLYGRADRIDQSPEGVAIIDYKSGGNFSKAGLENGNTPQLPLEALIVESGGFENIPPTTCTYLGYWVLNGNGKYTEIAEPQDIISETNAALITLIEIFENQETPYYAIPRSTKIPRYNDYEHLARIKEWAALDDSESEAA